MPIARYLSLILAILLLAHGYSVTAQSGSGTTMPNIGNPISPSPNAAALGKFGEVPVGYYTGIPFINIPIYEINSGGLKIPVSLDYHASGVKVQDIASWAGMGWALNAGGVITREVRGIPDEGGGGYLSTYDSITNFVNGTMTPDAQVAYYVNVCAGNMDSQQDMFFYNFGGTSGKFLFDSSGGVFTIPASRMKIEFGTFLGQSQVFKITDLQGNQFFFTTKEASTAGFAINGAVSSNSYAATSSWFLTKAVNALGTDSIVFNYAATTDVIQSNGTQTYSLIRVSGESPYCPGAHTDFGIVNNTTHALRLTSIDFKNGSVTFNTNTSNRCDLTSERALNSIVIQNTGANFYKKYQLYQSNVTSLGSACDTTHSDYNRLFLDSVTFADNVQVLGTYRMHYINRNLLPSRYSYSQDFWGYYNGAANSTSMVPSTILLNTIYGKVFTTSGANRNENFAYAEAGTLDTLSYPTGGKTLFEYEPNRAGNLTGSQDYAVATGHLFVFAPTGTTTSIDTSFTLNDDFASLGGVVMNWTINPGSGCTGAQKIGCPLTTVYYNGGSFSTNAAGNKFIPKGTVEVKVDFSTVTDSTIINSYTFQLTWQTGALSVDSLKYNIPVGGLRIKRITNYTNGNSVASVRQYQYNYPDSAYHSSGYIINYPSYFGSVTTNGQHTYSLGSYVDYACPWYTISSSPTSTMTMDQGSYVSYKYVEELSGANGEYGKTRYQFTAPDQYNDIISPNYPYPPAVSYDWERGKTVREQQFRYNSSNGLYELLQEKINAYTPYTTNNYPDIKIGQWNTYSYEQEVYTTDFSTGLFNSVVGWFPLLADTTRIYDQNDLTKYSQTINTYSYSNVHYQPIALATTNSKGLIRTTQMKYPLDYVGLSTSDNFTQGIINLQNKNIITPVIEKYTKLQNSDGSNTVITDGLVTSYRHDLPLPDTLWATEFAVGSPSFSPSSVSGGKATRDANYIYQVAFPRYDIAGNIAQQQKKTDAKRSYIWDYQSSLPIAEVINADSNSIAFTSFEADGAGNWSVGSGTTNNSAAFTGRHSYNLTGSISKSGLSSAAIYIVSYWSQNGSLSISGSLSGYPQKGKTVTINNSSWTLYVHKVSGQSTITLSGNATIDELRLYPVAAQMTTYTHDPLAGLTSQTDVANRVTYYEYDGIARLKRIRDQDYNILKSYEYQYQAPGGCGSGCSIVPLLTATGTNTIGYPVGVFSVRGKLLGNAAGPDDYVSKWNSDTADSHIGTLAKGGDSLHFQLSLNAGQTLPSGVTGCRYYQWDLAWNQIDGILSNSGAYVDFGDGTGMNIPKADSAEVVFAPNTFFPSGYVVHNYSDSSLKTITIYHSDGDERIGLDNGLVPATSLSKVVHLRGYFPQNATFAKFSSLQHTSALSIDSIHNWYSLTSLQILQVLAGDGGQTPCENLSFAQDFGKNLKGLKQWQSTYGGYRLCGIRDTTFKISRFKSDWNTYFTSLEMLQINDDHWNREDLSKLTHLNYFVLVATTDDHANDYSNSPMAIPSPVLDSVLNQIAAGAGQNVQNGYINLVTGGNNRTSASDAAVTLLQSRGWQIIIHW